MKTIYVITAFGGSHDDAWEANICACLTDAAAQDEVERLKAQDAKLKPIHVAISRAFYSCERGDIPELTPVRLQPRGPVNPTRESKTDHSRDMRVWRALCAPINEENARINDMFSLKRSFAAYSLAKELGADHGDFAVLGFSDMNGTPGDGKFFHQWKYRGDCSFSIEELEIR